VLGDGPTGSLSYTVWATHVLADGPHKALEHVLYGTPEVLGNGPTGPLAYTMWATHVLGDGPHKAVGMYDVQLHNITEASLLLDPEYGMLYLQISDKTSALDSLGAN